MALMKMKLPPERSSGILNPYMNKNRRVSKSYFSELGNNLFIEDALFLYYG